MNNENPFGEIIYSYTRAQAVADGFHVDVTSTAKQAGIRFPVFLTRSVFDAYVAVPEGVEGHNEAGRLWDIVWMLRFAIRKAAAHGMARVSFALYVRNDNGRPKLVKLVAACDALDVNDSQSAITVMMPDED